MATLYRRKNGRYYVLYQDGDRRRWHSFRTDDEKIAHRLFNNFKRDLQAGKIKPISDRIRKRFFDFVKEFLESKENIVEYSTYLLYDIALKKAKASWGDIPLNHITPRHIDQLISDMAKSGLQKTTINKNYRHIKTALKIAHEWKYLSEPIRFRKPLLEEETVRYLTINQLHSLLSKIDDQEFADLCLFSAYTALRSGEILRLKWRDIDNPEGFLRISPKQKNKRESWIPINKSARSILERCRARAGQKPFRFNTRTYISQLFKKYAREANLSHSRFHDLRHTFGSHLAMSGENQRVIQKLMRHRSMKSTEIYTNLSPEYLREASEKLNYGPMPLGPKKK